MPKIDKPKSRLNSDETMTDSGLKSHSGSFLEGLIDLFSGLEEYRSPYAPTVQPPTEVVDQLIQNASFKTGLVSATCSLPPGPLGILTILPELLFIYRIQGQLVKDIAAIYGKEVQVTRELLLYCMFKHGGAQVFRKMIEETSLKILIRPTTVRTFQTILERLGLIISRSILRKQFSRWIPLAGAVFTGTFAYYDTKRVGKTAMVLFSKEIESLNYESDTDSPLVAE
ncbi:MAG: EcsC family protein [Leptospira sp.]|nr:EcsC family protein [Leptospira sp.]